MYGSFTLGFPPSNYDLALIQLCLAISLSLNFLQILVNNNQALSFCEVNAFKFNIQMSSYSFYMLGLFHLIQWSLVLYIAANGKISPF